VFNGNLVIGAEIIFVHRYGAKETLKWLFRQIRERKSLDLCFDHKSFEP